MSYCTLCQCGHGMNSLTCNLARCLKTSLGVFIVTLKDMHIPFNIYYAL